MRPSGSTRREETDLSTRRFPKVKGLGMILRIPQPPVDIHTTPLRSAINTLLQKYSLLTDRELFPGLLSSFFFCRSKITLSVRLGNASSGTLSATVTIGPSG